jgi:hypothetical protein
VVKGIFLQLFLSETLAFPLERWYNGIRNGFLTEKKEKTITRLLKGDYNERKRKTPK